MKKVLIIAYHFPPLAGPGSERALKFVKYLPMFGWQPTVITTTNKNYWWYDKSLLNEIPKNTRISRAFEPELIYLESIADKLKLLRLFKYLKTNFIIPDESITWLPFALKKAKRELRRDNYRIIFTTSPPPTSHIIGYLLKKHFNIPWIAEYRDLWTLNPEYNTNKKLYHFEVKLERNIIKNTDVTIHTSKTNRQRFVNHFKTVKQNSEVIYNGFDINYDNINLKQNTHIFTITYTGSFYGKRSPAKFLKALKSFIKENGLKPGSLKFIFYGRTEYDLPGLINSYSLKDFVKINDPVPAYKLQDIYSKSDVLLLILPSNDPGAITKKVFDYMATRKPILAIVPEGEIREILSNSGLGYFAHPDSVKDITIKLNTLYNKWRVGKLLPSPRDGFINQFHRKLLTKKLAKIFETTI